MLQDVLPIKVKEETSSVEELEDRQAAGGRKATRKEAGVKKVCSKNVAVKNVAVKNDAVKKAALDRAAKAMETKLAPIDNGLKDKPRKALKRTGHPSIEVKRRQELDLREQEDNLRREALKSIQSRGRIMSRELPEEEKSGGGQDEWKKKVPCKYYIQGNCGRVGCPFGHGRRETLYIIDKSVTLKTIDVEKHMAMFGDLGGVKLVGLGPRGSEFEVKIALNPAQWKLEDMTKLTLWIGGVRVLVEDPPIFCLMSRAQRTRSESCSSRNELKEKDWPGHLEKQQWSRRRQELGSQQMSRQGLGESRAKRTRRDSSGSSSGK